MESSLEIKQGAVLCFDKAGAIHHYWRVNLNSSKNELRLKPYFYDPEMTKWEEGNEFIMQ